MVPAAGPKDQQTQKAAGLATKLPVLWQWTGPYFEHWSHCMYMAYDDIFGKDDAKYSVFHLLAKIISVIR